ncbi:pfs domain-containing protein [Colletotrichum asianum]|uniref:Pfs domain-containing protein n=1 Tax=Colletotrichum asianum TaxID=702518 RepID=A0A8H3WT84_9PEZI|nr:pfs domain-containing protein [Colletotrichum asianum]
MLHLHCTKATARILRNWENWSSMREYHVQHESSSNIAHVPKEFKIGVSFKRIWNRHFTGRNKTLQLMNDFLLPESQHQETRVAVIYGSGGVGKTQLALEYARKQEEIYGSIFWIDAHGPDTIKSSITECLKRILAHYIVNGISNSPRFHLLEKETESGRAIEGFLMWLAYEANRSWLLIIDNLDDLESGRLRELLPSTKWGSVLITSRRSDLAFTWNAIQVLVMDHDEALDLLVRSSNSNPEIGTKGMELFRGY